MNSADPFKLTDTFKSSQQPLAQNEEPEETLELAELT